MDSVPTFKKKKRPVGVSNVARPASPIETNAIASTSEEIDTTSATLEELLEMRKLTRRTGGMDLERLNNGEKKRVGKVSTQEIGKGKDRLRNEIEDDPDDEDAKTRRIVKSNNFTGQSETVDVDKHMMAYIEEELRKRKGDSKDFDSAKELQLLDPQDEIYQLAEKYKIRKTAVQEGNVTLSAAMLTAIPEVDLGIDIRLKNIEDTEKAKRAFFEEKQIAIKEEEEFAADRFYRARRPLESDSDALAKARREAISDKPAEKVKSFGAGRRELATDDQVMERFKKRQRK